MKTIDVKSLFIGFFSCACIFLAMGQTANQQIGKYQAFELGGSKFIIDTTSGATWHSVKFGKKWKRVIEADSFKN
jgi:hypothetical protein